VIGCKGYGDDMGLFWGFCLNQSGYKSKKEPMNGQSKQACE